MDRSACSARTDDDEHEEEPADFGDRLRDHLHERARGAEALEEVQGLPPFFFKCVCLDALLVCGLRFSGVLHAFFKKMWF